MKPKLLTFLVLALLGAILPTTASAAEPGIRAILVLASNKGGASDGRLAAYEPNLKRILRFESYKHAGEGAVVLAGGKALIKLGQGHTLEIESDKPEGKGGRGEVRVRVNWGINGRSAINTGLVLRPGVPAVLGGPSSGPNGEVWAVILVVD